MIEIDGSYGEGGGQILRTALFLSLVTGKSFRIKNIRKGRRNPGLKRQHLYIIKVLRKLTSSEVEGDELGSTEVVFYPGKVRGRYAEVDFKTAGSIPLFLQTVLPVLVFLEGNFKVKVKGGTDVPFSPTMDYFVNLYVPFLRRFGRLIDVKVVRRGFYPRGGGEVMVEVKGGFRKPEPILLSEGPAKAIKGISLSSKDLSGRSVSERQRLSAIRTLEGEFQLHPSILSRYEPSGSTGSSITLWLEMEDGGIMGSDALGKKGKRAEEVGKEAAEKLLGEWRAGGAVDSHLADHLVAILPFSGGSYTTSRVTDHLRTNIFVVNTFLPGSVHLDGNLVSSP